MELALNKQETAEENRVAEFEEILKRLSPEKKAFVAKYLEALVDGVTIGNISRDLLVYEKIAKEIGAVDIVEVEPLMNFTKFWLPACCENPETSMALAYYVGVADGKKSERIKRAGRVQEKKAEPRQKPTGAAAASLGLLEDSPEISAGGRWKPNTIKLLDMIENQATQQRIYKFVERLYVHS